LPKTVAKGNDLLLGGIALWWTARDVNLF